MFIAPYFKKPSLGRYLLILHFENNILLYITVLIFSVDIGTYVSRYVCIFEKGFKIMN